MKKLALTKLFLLLGAACALFIALRAPAVQNSYLRLYVGTRVSMITQGRGGGSGFLLEAPSGRNVIITNSHVCGNADVVGVDGTPSRVIKRDVKRDLCAISQTEDSSYFGLNLRETGPSAGELIYVVGHPRLDPQTVTSGEYVGTTEIGVAHSLADSVEQCEEEGLEGVETPFGTICFSRHLAGITTVSILGGNSGSLVTDYRGRVLAVMFASDDSNRGYMIRHDDLKAFVEGL